MNTSPTFSGDAQHLPEFLKMCEQLYNCFHDAGDPNNFQNNLLLTSFSSKSQGDAKVHISNVQINTWGDLKIALLEAYSDKRDTYTLTIEVT